MPPNSMEATQLRWLFHRISKLHTPRSEQNLFSIGGRGYYENPLSDLLGFFLDPSEGHGLGDLVLSALADCLPEPKPFPLTLESPPDREFQTHEGKRIDLVLVGAGWLIVLENKVTHGPDNPFEEYRATIEARADFARKQRHYVILAPYAPGVQGWTWVQHAQLINKVESRLGTRFIASGISKWVIFLREFILNLKQQAGASMNDQEFDFVQKNWPSFVDAMTLQSQYVEAAKARITAASRQVLGNEPARVVRKDWRDVGIALCVYPQHDRQHNAVLLLLPDGRFRVQFYVQENMRRPVVNRFDFTADGAFRDSGDESNGRIWVFVRVPDQENFDSGVKELERALSLLKEKTQ
jgi:hypothetical protein